MTINNEAGASGGQIYYGDEVNQEWADEGIYHICHSIPGWGASDVRLSRRRFHEHPELTLFFLDVATQEMVGYAVMKPHTYKLGGGGPAHEGRLYLSFIAVDQSKQGRGVGKILLQAVTDLARQNGALKVKLETTPDLAQFYQKARSAGVKVKDSGLTDYDGEKKIIVTIDLFPPGQATQPPNRADGG